MLKEPVITTISPASLTAKELVRFCTEFVDGDGMPRTFQKELLTRYVEFLDKVYDGDLVESDYPNEELEHQIENLECQVYDLESEVDRLTDELDALKTERNE
jgi:hypothetical protein